MLFSQGQKSGYLILPWFVLVAVGLASAFQMLLITDKGGIGDAVAKIDDEGEEEQAEVGGRACRPATVYGTGR